jgi:FtsZ-binding cell division protein ZapB
MGPAREQDVDSLARLEQRILRAVALVDELRRQKDAAEAKRDKAVGEAGEARALASKLSQELETLRAERQEVRARVEKLLGQMDLLNAG